MLKNPRVENTKTIREFQTSNNYSRENSLIIKADTSDAIQKIFLPITVDYYIFDKNGEQICYANSKTCSGDQIKELIKGELDNFSKCKNDSVTLEKILEQTYDLSENPITKSRFQKSDYYIVTYWAKYLGGKKAYEDTVVFLEDQISESNSSLKFTAININTDLQENWGFIAGGKAKLKYKQKGGNLTLTIDDLPIKK